MIRYYCIQQHHSQQIPCLILDKVTHDQACHVAGFIIPCISSIYLVIKWDDRDLHSTDSQPPKTCNDPVTVTLFQYFTFQDHSVYIQLTPFYLGRKILDFLQCGLNAMPGQITREACNEIHRVASTDKIPTKIHHGDRKISALAETRVSFHTCSRYSDTVRLAG